MKIFKLSLAIGVLAVCAGVSARAQDNPAQAAARAALMKSLYGDQTAPASAPTNDAPIMIDSSGVVGEKSTNPPPAMVAAPMSSSSDTEAQAKARAALEKKMAEEDALSPRPVVSKINKNYPPNQGGFTPIMAPPLPISAAKQMQLDALLDKYKADLITPEEYQKQRAAILAQQ